MGKNGRDAAESSKEGKKRSKRLRLAEVALNVLENSVSNTPLIITQNSPPHPNITTLGQPNNTTNSAFPTNLCNPSHPSSRQEDQLLKKKKRGKTMMKSLSQVPSERPEVEFNDKGQPIGPNSTLLSSYAGALVREMVPYNNRSWKKVDKKLKDDLWTCIQARFKIDDEDKTCVLQMMGLRWKESKSKLVSAIKDASSGPDAATMFVMPKPPNIKSDEVWRDFVKEKLSLEFELKSQKFKAIRAKNKIPHTTSRKGFARLAEDMKKDMDQK